MLEKLLLFGIGYMLGAKAGRERFDELVGMGRQFAERDEVKMVAGVVRGYVEERGAQLAGAGGGRLAA